MAAERRRTPRRRLRDRIASLDSTDNPALRSHHELLNQVLLVEDDLRQSALALGAVEGWLARSMALLEEPALSPHAIASHAADDEVVERLEQLAENLANLRRRLGTIASSIK
jgi:hypothetical protein